MSAGVPLGSSITVTFSEPVDPASVTPDAVRLANGATPVAGTVALAPGNVALSFRPASLLQSHTQYSLSIAATIRDTAGHALAAPFLSQFTTVDVTPPAPPPAGTVVASIPDPSGNTTMTGSQGTADPAGVVIVRNLRNNALTTLTPNADGSFSGVVAALRTDRLEMTIRDAAGNQTTVAVAPFRGADGSVVVGAAGGRVEGPGGVFVEIPVNAVPDGTIVRVAPLTSTDFPVAPLADFPFIAGVALDLGGIVPREPLDIGVMAPAGASVDDQVIVGRLGTLAGRRVWSVDDRAHLRDGRYETASPPFTGIVTQGSYGFLRIANNCMSWVTVNYQFQADYAVTILGLPFVNFTTHYSTATLPAICNSLLDVQVVTLDTEQVIQAATHRAPAVRDEIGQLPGVLTDDDVAPETVGTNQPSGYQVDEFEWKFSEPMSAESVRNGLLVSDRQGNPVDGAVEFFDGFRRMVFRPAVPFQPGERYTVSLSGATDLAGNLFEGEPITFTPFETESLSRLANTPELRDVLRVCRSADHCTSAGIDVAVLGNTLFIANGVRSRESQYASAVPSRLIAVDVSDPRHPRLIGFHQTATNPRALATVRHATFPIAGGMFAGDLLLVAGGGHVPGGELGGKLEILDVSTCTARPLPDSLTNCLQSFKGARFLSTPSGALPLEGVPPAPGVPLQIAALHSRGVAPAADTVVAYVTVAGLGLMAVDVVRAFDNVMDPDGDRGPHAFIQGDFLDVGVLKNRVVAVEAPGPGGISALKVFSTELLLVRVVVLAETATRLALVSNLVVDVDRDGNLGLAEDDDLDPGGVIEARDELFDLAFVTSALSTPDACGASTECGALSVIDLSSLTDLPHPGPPVLIGRVPLPGPAFSLAIDPGRLTAYVEVRGHGVALVDLKFIVDRLSGGVEATTLVDANHDGHDDRVLRIFPKPDIMLSRLKVDLATGIAYTTGENTGPELIQVCNVCNELALDFRPHPSAVRGRTLEQERDAVAAIVADARVRIARLLGPHVLFYFLEQGSGSCLWAEGDLAANCARTGFELGTSDHDIEVMVPQFYAEAAQHAINNLLTDVRQATPPPVDDLNMFVVPREAFENAILPVTTPINLQGSDPAGDLGMGRQQLLLLWLLTGEYADAGLNPNLDSLLETLQTTSGIPAFEGYERVLLEKFNFYRTGAMLRIKGACESSGTPVTLSDAAAATLIDITNPGRNFDGPNVVSLQCQKELHSVAKAAVRAAMGRLAGHSLGSLLLLDVTRERFRSATGCLTGVDNPLEPPEALALYSPKPCGSFEEFIASTAVRSAQHIFTPNQIRQIVRFACVKVGGAQCRDRNNDPLRAPGVPLFESDTEANDFIVEALRFIEDMESALEASTPVVIDPTPINQIPGGLGTFFQEGLRRL